VSVKRELAAGERDRVDLLVKVDGVPRTLLEAKVPSGLGQQQLARYCTSYTGDKSYKLVYPARLLIHAGTAITWESLLTVFAASGNVWVAETARAWLDHLANALTEMHPDIRWNVLRERANFALAMRTRISWVYGQLAPSPPT
jgi:hypothetical protein